MGNTAAEDQVRGNGQGSVGPPAAWPRSYTATAGTAADAERMGRRPGDERKPKLRSARGGRDDRPAIAAHGRGPNLPPRVASRRAAVAMRAAGRGGGGRGAAAAFGCRGTSSEDRAT